MTLIAANCANHLAPVASSMPASEPASMPAEFMLLDRGQEAPANGFFLSIRGARNELQAREKERLNWQLQLEDAHESEADAKAERDASIKQLSLHDFCSRWCLEIGLVGGIIAGAIAGGVIGEKLGEQHAPGH